MIERADFDQDGVVSQEEFYNLLTKKAYWKWSLCQYTCINSNIYLKNLSINIMMMYINHGEQICYLKFFILDKIYNCIRKRNNMLKIYLINKIHFVTNFQI